MYRWKIQPTLYVSFCTIIFNNIIMKISNICVSIIGNIPHLISIHWWRINSQYFMLSHPIFHNISSDTKNRNILDTYVSRWCLYNLPNELSKDGINSQYSMLVFHNNTTSSQKHIFKGVLPTFMSKYSSSSSWKVSVSW